MKVILRDDVKSKGKAGQVIDVKPGYARNYLIPQGFAYVANENNVKVFEQEKYKRAKLQEQLKVENEKLKTELEKISLTSVVKVDEEGHLYGSVSAHTISELLKEKGLDIPTRKILLEEHIKELGVFEVSIDLGHEMTAKVKVWVVKE